MMGMAVTCMLLNADVEAYAKMASDRPPHFPDPNADPIALLEAALVEKDQIIAAQYAEMTGWRMQLEAALVRLSALGAK